MSLGCGHAEYPKAGFPGRMTWCWVLRWKLAASEHVAGALQPGCLDLVLVKSGCFAQARGLPWKYRVHFEVTC